MALWSPLTNYETSSNVVESLKIIRKSPLQVFLCIFLQDAPEHSSGLVGRLLLLLLLSIPAVSVLLTGEDPPGYGLCHPVDELRHAQHAHADKAAEGAA